MPHLLATLAPGDRRAGGRHGRPGGRTAPAATVPIRTQLLRLTLLPAAVVTLGSWTAVLCAVRALPGDPGAGLWAVLGGSAAVTLAGLAAAVSAACRRAGALRERIVGLRRQTARRHTDLRALAESLRHGEEPPAARPAAPAAPGGRGDELDLLAGELSRAHDAAVTALAHATRLSREAAGARGGPQGTVPVTQVIEVFVNLARRLQSLAHREISLLDELENEIEDPDLLECLFHVDHLATRMRRYAENLAVLGGAAARRRWSRPVPVVDVLRSAVAEVEQYQRVRLVPPTEGTLRGHAVADVIHLLAELIENATAFSAPDTPVLLRVCTVTSGLAVEVEDRGLGLPAPEQARMNLLLSDPARVDVAGLLRDGRIGLYVVSRLAGRHGVSVRLQTNIYGGTQAVLVLPRNLLGADRAPFATPLSGTTSGTTATPTAKGPAAGPTTGAAAGPAIHPAGHGTGIRPAAAPFAAAAPTARDHTGGAPAPGPSPVHGAAGGGSGHGRAGAPALQHTGGDQAQCQTHGRAREHPRQAPGPLPVPGAAPASAAQTSAASMRPAPSGPVPHAGQAVEADRAGLPVPAPRGTFAVPPGAGAPAEHGGHPGRPRLPRRQAQQHLAPQLRAAPATRPVRDTGSTGPATDLMAAFRRGFGRGEAEPEPHAVPGHEAPARPERG